jgi:hypothetical protein
MQVNRPSTMAMRKVFDNKASILFIFLSDPVQYSRCVQFSTHTGV